MDRKYSWTRRWTTRSFILKLGPKNRCLHIQNTFLEGFSFMNKMGGVRCCVTSAAVWPKILRMVWSFQDLYIYIFIYKEYNISYLDHEPGKSNVKHLSLFVAQALLHHEAAVTSMYRQVCKKSTWKESKQTWTTRTHISLVFGKNHEVCVCAKALSNCCTRKTINFNELMTQIVPFGAALSTVGWMTRPRYPSMNQACRMKGIISYDIMT